jgi:rare lipoprotein A
VNNKSLPLTAALVVSLGMFMPLTARAQQAPATPGAPAAPAPAPAAPAAAAPAPAAQPAPAAASTGSAERGKLAWYGRKFTGRKTASGERYNPDALTMAHKDLPFGTKVKVTNLKNNRSVSLRVNDRGPTQGDRVGDVSLAGARALGMVRAGVIDAELQVVSSPAPKKS